MSGHIVASEKAITLVGAGFMAQGDLTEALALAPALVAADGGARAALAAGLMPQAVIGDFDSLDADLAARIPADRLHRITEQDSTDFDKALRSVHAPLVLAVGCLGDRLDHQLAVLNALARHPDRPCIVIGSSEIVLHVSGVLQADLEPGDVVSLFPMAPVRGRSEGLEWPIDGLLLEPGGRVGTSNRATGPVRIETGDRGLLALLPRRALEGLTRRFVQV